MTNKELELVEQLTEVAMMVAGLKAENKILKDTNEKLTQALRLQDAAEQREKLPPSESELKRIFLNRFDCYTEGATDDGWKSEPAMTVDRFIEVAKTL